MPLWKVSWKQNKHVWKKAYGMFVDWKKGCSGGIYCLIYVLGWLSAKPQTQTKDNVKYKERSASMKW